jgi:predicted Zn-dependent peptidase
LKFREHVLPNGLEIVAECNDEAYSTAVAFFVKTGARDEADPVAGVSHFLEHMMFKGTASRSADDVNREFDEMGAHYNAFTSEENTVYYATVLPEYQNQVVELLGDILRPALREEDFDTEKKVILEEIQMYEDQPPFGADDKARAIHFGSHPLGRSVLGTPESVGNLPVHAMRDYFRRRYCPANITLVAAGHVDFDQLVAVADRQCGDWESVAAQRIIQPYAAHDGFHLLTKETATQQYLLQMSPGPAAEDADRYAVKLLATVLGDDSGSRLYWDIVDPGLAEHVSLGHCEYHGAGTMITYMSCDPEQAADNLQRIADAYRQAETDGITTAELDQAKNKIRSRIVLSSERPRGRLFVLGTDWLYRRTYRPTEADLTAVTDITVDDLTTVLAKYPLRRATTVTIGPLNSLAPAR